MAHFLSQSEKSATNKGIILSKDDEIYAKKLQRELKTLDSEKDKETKERAEAILRILNKEGIMNVSKDTTFDKKTLNRWTKIYRLQGLKGLPKTKNSIAKPKKDRTNYKSLASMLNEELEKLNEKKYPRTKKRAEAILPILEGGKTKKERAEELNYSERAIQKWIDRYEKNKIKELKAIENHGLRRKSKKNHTTHKKNSDAHGKNTNVPRLLSKPNYDSDDSSYADSVKEPVKKGTKTTGLTDSTSEPSSSQKESGSELDLLTKPGNSNKNRKRNTASTTEREKSSKRRTKQKLNR